ncbi:transcriptional repressor [Patescibacteria group bacterium]|nr:transcriptional repressor [Patescibacteria group bacterium]
MQRDIKTEINQTGDRLTKQRQVILDYLQKVTCHPTAEIVYNNVRRKLPHISLGTVYRNLDYLVDREYALELNTTDAERHFDGCIREHWHYICDKCGTIYDLRRAGNMPVRKKVCWGKVERTECNLYGICKKCARRKK